MTAIAIIFRVAVIFFIVEGLIMFGLLQVESMISPAIRAIADTVVLVLLAAPVTYFWVIRPYIQISANIEKNLQIQVEKRNLDLTQEIDRRKKAMALLEDEINAARLMQEGLLPSPDLIKNAEDECGLKIASYFKASSILGGDLWGLHRRGMIDGQTGFFMVDFTGHGVSAALNIFRLDAIMGETRPPSGDPAAYLAFLNDQLARLLPTGHFATFFYGVLDVKSNIFTYAAAATPPPIFYRDGAKEFDFLNTSGIPLGIQKGAIHENRQIDFSPGSLLFLYSDAFTETLDKDGKSLQEEGVRKLLQESLERVGLCSPLSYFTDAFHDKVGQSVSDDLTAVMIRRI